jgi:hypothetical protein
MQETGCRRQDAGDRMQEAGGRMQEAGRMEGRRTERRRDGHLDTFLPPVVERCTELVECVFARRIYWEDHRIKMRKRIETRRQGIERIRDIETLNKEPIKTNNKSKTRRKRKWPFV